MVKRAEHLRVRMLKQRSIASAVERLGRNPYAFLSAIVSAMGSNASKCNACCARHVIVGIESGRIFPVCFFGI